MKNRYVIIIFSLFLSFPIQAQDLYEIELLDYHNDIHHTAHTQKLKLPNSKFTMIMGGLNNWDGLGNYFNVFGSKLIIDSIDPKADGSKQVVLRREDGRNFFDYFPTLTAKLTPVHLLTKELTTD